VRAAHAKLTAWRLAQAPVRAELLEGEELVHLAVRAVGDLDAAGHRRLLHARRDVHGIAHRGVLDLQVGSDGAHNDQTGVDTDPHIEVDAPLTLDFGLETLNVLEDLESREDGASSADGPMSQSGGGDRKPRVSYRSGFRDDAADTLRSRPRRARA
jgi:hypothetical protein